MLLSIVVHIGYPSVDILNGHGAHAVSSIGFYLFLFDVVG